MNVHLSKRRSPLTIVPLPMNTIVLREHERKEVTDRFPLAQWPTMPWERYALGQDTSDDTFCQWM